MICNCSRCKIAPFPPVDLLYMAVFSPEEYVQEGVMGCQWAP